MEYLSLYALCSVHRSMPVWTLILKDPIFYIQWWLQSKTDIIMTEILKDYNIVISNYSIIDLSSKKQTLKIEFSSSL